MLKEFKGSKDEDSGALKTEIKALRERLLAQQQLVRDQKLPVVVLVEGWAAAGKGSLINELISEIDPRFYNVVSPVVLPEKEERYPFLYQYAKAIPENGKIMFYDSGWMEGAVRKFLRRDITKKQYKDRIRAVNEFERQLRDGGYLILKLFLHIDQDEQRKRLNALRENYETEWRVTEEDLWQHREYKLFRETYDEFMDQTGKTVKWHVLDGDKKKMAARDALKLLVEMIDTGLNAGRYIGKPFSEKFPLIKMQKLSEVDLSPKHSPHRPSAGSEGLRRDAYCLSGTPRDQQTVSLALLDKTAEKWPYLHLRPHLVRPRDGGASGRLLHGR